MPVGHQLTPSLKQLRLLGILDTLEARTRQVIEGQWPYSDFLSRLLQDSVERRARNNWTCACAGPYLTLLKRWMRSTSTTRPSPNPGQIQTTSYRNLKLRKSKTLYKNRKSTQFVDLRI